MPRGGTTRKDALKKKALHSKEKILQVCDILITVVIEIHT